MFEEVMGMFNVDGRFERLTGIGSG